MAGRHAVKYHAEHEQYAPFCKCGADSVVCQKCGQAVCATEIETKSGRNICFGCSFTPMTNLKGNPGYDLMM